MAFFGENILYNYAFPILKAKFSMVEIIKIIFKNNIFYKITIFEDYLLIF